MIYIVFLAVINFTVL